jgi:hypothetical protein
MHIDTFLQQIEQIRQKVVRLQRRNLQLEAGQQVWREKAQALQLQLQESRRMVGELESQLKILKIAKGIQQDPKAKQEAKLKINEFIKEIDKCIALMND